MEIRNLWRCQQQQQLHQHWRTARKCSTSSQFQSSMIVGAVVWGFLRSLWRQLMSIGDKRLFPKIFAKVFSHLVPIALGAGTECLKGGGHQHHNKNNNICCWFHSMLLRCFFGWEWNLNKVSFSSTKTKRKKTALFLFVVRRKVNIKQEIEAINGNVEKTVYSNNSKFQVNHLCRWTTLKANLLWFWDFIFCQALIKPHNRL